MSSINANRTMPDEAKTLGQLPKEIQREIWAGAAECFVAKRYKLLDTCGSREWGPLRPRRIYNIVLLNPARDAVIVEIIPGELHVLPLAVGEYVLNKGEEMRPAVLECWLSTIHHTFYYKYYWRQAFELED